MVPKNVDGLINLGTMLVSMKLQEGMFKAICKPNSLDNPNMVERINNSFGRFKASAWKFIKSLPGRLLDGLSWLGGQIASLGKFLGQKASEAASRASSWIKGGGLGETVAKGWESFASGASRVGAAIGRAAEVAGKVAMEAAEALYKGAELAAWAVKGLLKGVMKLAGFILDGAEFVGEKVIGPIINKLAQGFAKRFGMDIAEDGFLPPPADVAALALQMLTMVFDMWDPTKVNVLLDNKQIASMAKTTMDQVQQGNHPYPIQITALSFIKQHPDYMQDYMSRMGWYQSVSPRGALHQEHFMQCFNMAYKMYKQGNLDMEKAHMDSCWVATLAKKTQVPVGAGGDSGQPSGPSYKPPKPQVPQIDPGDPSSPSVQSPATNPPPQPPSPTTPAPHHSSGKLSKTNLIIICVVCSVVGILVIALGSYYGTRKSSPAVAPRLPRAKSRSLPPAAASQTAML